MAPSRVWLLTGCSTGIGRATAAAAIAAGEQVIVTARRSASVADFVASAPDRVLALALDVTDEASVASALEQGLARFGRLDVLVNNAGVGLVGAVEESLDADVRRLYDTNLFGTLNVTRAVLPVMRRQGGGHIVFVTSIGAVSPAPSVAIYNSSKAALDAIAEALRAEVAELGIRVTSVLPGLIKTDFRSRGIVRAPVVLDAYESTVGRVRVGIEAPYPETAGDPEQVGRAIVEIVRTPGAAPLRVALGADAVSAMHRKIGALQAELAQWEAFGLAHGGDADSLALYKIGGH